MAENKEDKTVDKQDVEQTVDSKDEINKENANNESEDITDTNKQKNDVNDKNSKSKHREDKKKDKNEDSKKDAELEKVKKDLEESNNKFLRLAADFDNYKKRTSAEKDALRGIVVSDTIQIMLPVIDNLERALDAAKDSSPLRDGVEMVLTQAKSNFEKFGITSFGKRGDKFDPEIHNAVMTCDDSDLESGQVEQVLQEGYKIGERIIRHALVKVVN